MKVLFLDIDGVLNSRVYDARCALTGGDLLQPDPRAVVRLMGILQDVEAIDGERPKIVLTSSWRRDKTTVWPFPVYSGTPYDGAFRARADEIGAWLALHDDDGDGEGLDFVIVDDEPDAGIGFGDRFVRTDPAAGLTAADAAKIVGLFTTRVEGNE